MKDSESFQSMKILGGSDLVENRKKAAIHFGGAMYGSADCESLNEIRIIKVKSNNSVKPRKLPLANNAFLLHLFRCQYQLLMWRQALTPMLQIPDFMEYGYETEPVS